MKGFSRERGRTERKIKGYTGANDKTQNPSQLPEPLPLSYRIVLECQNY